MGRKSRRRKTWTGILCILLTPGVCVEAQNSVSSGQPTASVTILDSTKDQDGLIGSVRRVKILSAKLELGSGQLLEGPPQLLEITTYGLNGNRIGNVTYPVASSPVGKEEYKYNDKGNIVEMTLRGDDGSIRSREKYEYEFDTFGNWTKMVTSLVLFENGELKYEPVEVTHRELAYYFDNIVAKIINPTPSPIALPPASSTSLGRVIAARPEIEPDKVVSSDQSPLFEVIGEPPELRAPRMTNEAAVTGSEAGSGKASNIKGEPAAISSTAAEGFSAEVRTVLKGAASAAPAVNKGADDYYKKGKEYFDLGALQEAVIAYQQSLELEPRSADVYLSLGHAYFRLKNHREAGKAFKQATLLNPDMAEAHYSLGLHYFAIRRNENAAQAFKRATLLSPDMAKAHYGLALAYQELGKLDALMAEYRVLQKLDPGLAKKLSDTFP